MSPAFQPAELVLPRAKVILRRERRRLRRLGVPGELVLTGGSSLPGALTGGDIDLHLRLPPAEFSSTVRALTGGYRVVHPEIWSPTLATFAVAGDERIGIAATPLGSEHDLRFSLAWERLRTDPAVLEAYNALKRSHAGADDFAYLAAKAAFFNDLAIEGRGHRAS